MSLILAIPVPTAFVPLAGRSDTADSKVRRNVK
jgi:hypothetical protein